MSFDPYHEWLGIPPSEQPPNHYRLLGITPFEADPDVISQAAVQRTEQVRTASSGQPADLAQRFLNEIAAARLSLLDPKIKWAYDADLAKRTPPPIPPPTPAATPPPITTPPASIRTVRRRRSPPLVGLVLLGAALATGAAALALWWQSAEPQQAGPKDQAVADSRAVVSSHENSASPSSTKRADHPVEHRATEVAPARKPEPPKTPPPVTVVAQPVVTPPVVTKSPAKKTNSSTTVRVQKGKAKKKAAKKLDKSGPKWKTNAAGYPTISGRWQGGGGRSITVVQQRGQLTVSGVSIDSRHREAHWRWIGSIDKQGHLIGHLVYTRAPSDFQDGDTIATLSPDGKTISGKSGGKAGLPDLPWKKQKKKSSAKSK